MHAGIGLTAKEIVKGYTSTPILNVVRAGGIFVNAKARTSQVTVTTKVVDSGGTSGYIVKKTVSFIVFMLTSLGSSEFKVNVGDKPIRKGKNGDS